MSQISNPTLLPVDIPNATEEEPRTTVISRLRNPPSEGKREHASTRYLREQIDWESRERENSGTYREDGRIFYFQNSTPVWYIFGGKSSRMVDLVVVGSDIDETAQKWKHELEEADKERERLRELVRKELLPELEGVSSIVTVLGRGSVYDPRRVVERDPDVDLILFLHTPLETSADIEAVAAQLATIQSKLPHIAIGITTYSFCLGDAAFFDPQLPTDPNIQMKVKFDLMSYVGPSSFVSYETSSNRPIRPYYQDCLRNGAVLLDRSEGVFENVRATILGKAAKLPTE
jgi:hypothetical protein